MQAREMLRWLCGAFCLTGAACTSDEWPADPADYVDDGAGSSDDGDDGAAVGASGTQLRIFEPESASIHFIGEPLPLIAEVTDASGAPTTMTGVRWGTDAVDYALGSDAMSEVTLPAGIYDITAQLEVPGDGRLSASVGGVRVQSPNTGVYAGEIAMTVEVDLQGMALTPVCRGAMAVTIDMQGETLTAEPGECTLDLLLFSFPAAFEVDATLYGNAVSGEVTYTFAGLFSSSFQFEGTLFDDTLFAGFVGELAIPLILTAPANGTLVAAKLSPYVDL